MGEERDSLCVSLPDLIHSLNKLLARSLALAFAFANPVNRDI